MRKMEALFRAKDMRPAMCQRHGEYISYLLPCQHKEIWSRCPECEKELQLEKDLHEEANARAEIAAWRIEQLMGQACIPPRFANRSFENFRTDEDEQKMALRACMSYAVTGWEDTMKTGRSLCILGRPGTGKTHLAAAMVRSVISRGFPAVYVREADIFRRIKETYMSRSVSERQAMADFVKPALLVIDEVGRQYGTPAERFMFFDVIDRRYENMKPTILISNLDKTHFRELLGLSLFSRLAEGGGQLLVLAGKDMRLEASHGVA